MVTLRNLIPFLDEFLVGDETTHKILKPEVVAFDDVIDARVAAITAKSNTPVVWVVLPQDEEDKYEF